jgi:hypothetical protein
MTYVERHLMRLVADLTLEAHAAALPAETAIRDEVRTTLAEIDARDEPGDVPGATADNPMQRAVDLLNRD